MSVAMQAGTNMQSNSTQLAFASGSRPSYNPTIIVQPAPTNLYVGQRKIAQTVTNGQYDTNVVRGFK
jgi:hypothetical protein